MLNVNCWQCGPSSCNGCTEMSQTPHLKANFILPRCSATASVTLPPVMGVSVFLPLPDYILCSSQQHPTPKVQNLVQCPQPRPILWKLLKFCWRWELKVSETRASASVRECTRSVQHALPPADSLPRDQFSPPESLWCKMGWAGLVSSLGW